MPMIESSRLSKRRRMRLVSNVISMVVWMLVFTGRSCQR